MHVQNTELVNFIWFQMMHICFCHPQLELLGQSIYDFIHPCDQEELRDVLAPRPGQTHSYKNKKIPQVETVQEEI